MFFALGAKKYRDYRVRVDSINTLHTVIVLLRRTRMGERVVILSETDQIGKKVASRFAKDLHYKGENVGTYFADIVVDDKIILELG